MNDPKFTNRAGELTAYALACGYIERRESGANSVELGKFGGQRLESYYVYLRGTSGLMGYGYYQTLTQARRAYKSAARHLNNPIKSHVLERVA